MATMEEKGSLDKLREAYSGLNRAEKKLRNTSWKTPGQLSIVPLQNWPTTAGSVTQPSFDSARSWATRAIRN
ncbi:hypothetical protein ALO_16811 [Acetonema longum DSM 6540]|uniref:Uncharacterized protein n=1 Tax=Acetonema longum DSM 6540 TaxID=1009370 RepID=F7NMN1_9FIRM|nr:hypothetical protein ALO_16811 [Acetonema longum DSM 6540]